MNQEYKSKRKRMGGFHHLSISISILTLLIISKHVYSSEMNNFGSSKSKCVWPTKKYYIHIMNQLPPDSKPLTVHCVSRNDDLGTHTLGIAKEIQWHFCDDLFNSVFYCYFLWDKLKTTIYVFDQDSKLKKLCNNKLPGQGKHTCFYSIAQDGIYLATLDGFVKREIWY